MAIDKLDFDAVTEIDLAELITAQVPEGLRIDYKLSLYGNTDKDKREALKDISSFANATGGHLVIGMAERSGLPTGLPGLQGLNAEQEILRIEQLARSGIEPIALGIRVRAIPLQAGGHCLVVRVPRSWQAPHRVTAQGVNRFYIRNSSGVHEASMEELRTIFTAAGDVVDHLQNLRSERIQRLAVPGPTRALAGGGRVILHVAPLVALTSRFQVDLAPLDGGFNVWAAFAPLDATTSGEFRFNLDGAIIERGNPELAGYTQVFRSGVVESLRANVLRQPPAGKVLLSAFTVENMLVRALPRFIERLQFLGVPPPFVVAPTLTGVAGAIYRVSQSFFDDPVPALDRDVVFLPHGMIEAFGAPTDYHRALRPAFDALWNSTGKARAEWFADSGAWTGPPQGWS